SRLAVLDAEISGLERMLAAGQSGDFPPLIDQITVLPGYEAALAALLGEDIRASLDEKAPIHWLDLPPVESTGKLPGGVTPLTDKVSAPPRLARFLAGIGVVEGDAPGRNAILALKPGQALVSLAGGVWRWDG